MSSPKTVLLMRHAKSSWGDANLSDHDRPLNKRGKWGAPLMGERLKELGLLPDLMLVSSAKRAQQTSELVAQASGYDGRRETEKRLYLAEPSTYFDLFTEVVPGTQRVLLIAHNPGIADLVEIMTGTPVEMCTSGLAHIECEVEEIADLTSQARCHLKGFHRPPPR